MRSKPCTVRRPRRLPFLLPLACLPACGGGGGSSPGTVTPQVARVSAAPVYVDRDSDGAVGAGDAITVRFDRPVSVRAGSPVPFRTLVTGDSLGNGARLEAGNRADEVRIVLGAGARLRASGVFAGTGEGGPSALRLDASDAIVDAATGDAATDDVDRDLASGLVERALAASDGSALAAGDVDADGDLDLLVGRDGGPAVLYRNDGAAAFAAGPLLGEGDAVALGDVDGDGDLDAVVGGDPGTTDVWRNDAGSFVLGQTIAAGRAASVALGDLDGDGDADLAIGGAASEPDRVWWNDGVGTFGPGPVVGGGNTWTLELADVDRDGDLDLLQGRSGQSRIWRNDGGGAFTGGQTIGAGTTRAIVAADLDCDGDVDLVTAGRDPAEAWRNGGGTWTSTGRLANAATDALALLDLDGDGHLDVYAANANGQDDEVWALGQDLVLQPTAVRIANGTTTDAVAGDFDRDGDTDVATIGDGSLRLLVSSLSAARGPVAFGLPATFASNGEALALVTADFDRDGDADVVELQGLGGDAILWRNDGIGFAQAQLLGVGAVAGAAVDVDRDGDVDLVATGPNGLRLWRNTGTALPPTADTVGTASGVDLALADVDRDGDLDLVHARASAGPAQLWLGDGNGGFGLVHSPLPSDAAAVEVADVDRDGRADVLLATPIGLRVLRGTGGGALAAPVTFGTEALDVLAVGDVDRDGDPDAVVGGPAGTAFWRNDAGAFTAAGLTGMRVRTFELADLDGDGDLDVLRGGDGADEWWRNDNGALVPAPIALSAGPTNDFAAVDLDCDGDLDVVVADGSPAGGLRVFRRR